MIYKFKSKAAGDVIMMPPTAERVLAAIGKPPGAQGIIEPGVMLSAIAALEQAIAADEASRAGTKDADTPAAGDAMSLRRRAWPMVEMLKRSQAANEPIVWGV